MLLLTFQISLLALIGLSLLLVIGIPVIFASPNGWNENKNYITIGATAWITLVLLVGSLNYFVI